MIENARDYLGAADRNREQVATMVERIFGAARPGAVFSEPVTSGNYTVITAQEISSGGGFGSGGGYGSAGATAAPSTHGEVTAAKAEDVPGGGGGGMGGGGGAMGRPVAAIIIGPDGVRVEPIVDASKVAIAALTTFVAMAALFGKMRGRRG